MLNENIKLIRKSKGLSQEELAAKLNVVRQTVSKWEQGLSVPSSELLLTLSEVLETPVSILLGESVAETKAEDLKVISEKLEIINLQLSQIRRLKVKKRLALFISVLVAIIAVFIILLKVDSPYLGWDYTDPEKAVVGVALHAFEWLFIRLSPVAFIGCVIGLFYTLKKQ